MCKVQIDVVCDTQAELEAILQEQGFKVKVTQFEDLGFVNSAEVEGAKPELERLLKAWEYDQDAHEIS